MDTEQGSQGQLSNQSPVFTSGTITVFKDRVECKKTKSDTQIIPLSDIQRVNWNYIVSKVGGVVPVIVLKNGTKIIPSTFETTGTPEMEQAFRSVGINVVPITDIVKKARRQALKISAVLILILFLIFFVPYIMFGVLHIPTK